MSASEVSATATALSWPIEQPDFDVQLVVAVAQEILPSEARDPMVTRVKTVDRFGIVIYELREGDDGMVRIVVTPTWAKLIDFETTLPNSVAELARQRDERQRA